MCFIYLLKSKNGSLGAVPKEQGLWEEGEGSKKNQKFILKFVKTLDREEGRVKGWGQKLGICCGGPYFKAS